jgi:disulfide bond formation protein DsbB
MTRRQLFLLATLGSLGLLLGAFAFQYIGGLAPCELCIWQRWPHAVAILIGIVALTTGKRILGYLGALAVLFGSGVALYHVGIEQKWWLGPTTCTSGSTEGLTTEQLLDQIMAAPLIRCDEIAWEMLNISMAGWNGLISVALAAIWILAARKT